MNKTFLLSALTGFVLVLALGLPMTAQAVNGAYNYVNEIVATWNTHTGKYTDVTTTGYPPTNKHAYEAMSGNYTNTWMWWCKSATTTNYNYHVWIAIPYNTGVLDGTYPYTVYNSKSKTFSVNINQENYVNQWVYIGWSQGTGGATCGVATNNHALGTDFNREFWIDHMKYWPNLSSIPPIKTHKW